MILIRLFLSNIGTASAQTVEANLAQVCYFSDFPGIPIFDKPECKPGFFCPFVNQTDPATVPRICLESPQCKFRRIYSTQCIDGYFGAQGRYEPVMCRKGFYCPTPLERIPCPRGYFCPSGTVTPKKCDFLASCPEGSVTQASYTGIAIFLILDVLVAVICILRYLYERKLSKLSNEKQHETVEYELPDKVKSKLAESFKKSMNGKDLRMHFRMKNLGFTLPDGKVILNGISGVIKHSRMTAIMGPSGAGKTTFLNVLSGKTPTAGASGELFINNRKSELTKYKKIYGFVPQDDVMHNELTVRENILHSGRIRLPSYWNSKDIEEHVDNVIEALDLSHVANIPIGDGTTRGVSGGQRKRVNIGMELVATPLCLCLDEPTSGLDSTAALEVSDILRRISHLGITILAVIHQPRVEIFKKFDDVLMIAPGGKTAYLGPTEGARPYFENLGYIFTDGSNEADVLMDILSGSGVNHTRSYNIEELLEEWNKHAGKLDSGVEEGEDTSEIDKSFYSLADTLVKERGAGFFSQMFYVHNLSLLQQYRAWPGLILEVFVGATAGILMGVAVSAVDEIFAGVFNAPYQMLSSAPIHWLVVQFIMLVGIAVSLSAAPAGVKVFSEDLHVYWRNAASGHNVVAYYLGKTMASFYRMTLASLHFAGILYFLSAPTIGFEIEFGVIFLFFFGVYSLSAFVSMVVRRENATLLAVIIALFAAVFCGYGLTIHQAKEWGIYFVWAIQFNMWGAEAFFSESLKIYKGIYDLDLCNEEYGYTFDRVLFDFGMMVFIGCVWRTFAFVGMVFLNRDKQR
jgi:ABC-type multidrug transport system ATPase subunit